MSERPPQGSGVAWGVLLCWPAVVCMWGSPARACVCPHTQPYYYCCADLDAPCTTRSTDCAPYAAWPHMQAHMYASTVLAALQDKSFCAAILARGGSLGSCTTAGDRRAAGASYPPMHAGGASFIVCARSSFAAPGRPRTNSMRQGRHRLHRWHTGWAAHPVARGYQPVSPLACHLMQMAALPPHVTTCKATAGWYIPTVPFKVQTATSSAVAVVAALIKDPPCPYAYFPHP